MPSFPRASCVMNKLRFLEMRSELTTHFHPWCGRLWRPHMRGECIVLAQALQLVGGLRVACSGQSMWWHITPHMFWAKRNR
jgi:hypothetical protein